MSVRSEVLGTQEWQEKVPEYIQEAQELGVKIYPPSVLKSTVGFSIQDDEVYFGLNGIRDVGMGITNAIIHTRTQKPFVDIYDFVYRLQGKINAKNYAALVYAGAFDCMNYSRAVLIDNMREILDYYPLLTEAEAHNAERLRRIALNEVTEQKREAFAEYIKSIKKKQKTSVLSEKEQTALSWKEHLKNYQQELPVPDSFYELYSDYGDMAKLSALKEKSIPNKLDIPRIAKIDLSVNDLMVQADFIGCYLSTHPAKKVFPYALSLDRVDIAATEIVAGHIVDIKEIKTKRGQQMAFGKINDGTSTAEFVIFEQVLQRLASQQGVPIIGDIVAMKGKIKSIDPSIQIVVNNIIIHKEPT